MQTTDTGSSAPTPLQTLERLRAAMNITTRELATLFGQSRRVVDGWFHGVAPDDLDTQRIAQLGHAVEALAAAGAPVTVATLRRKVTGAPTILSAIAEGDNLQAVVQRLIDTLTRETSQRDRLRQQIAGRGRAAFDPGDFGAPAWVEDLGAPVRADGGDMVVAC